FFSPRGLESDDDVSALPQTDRRFQNAIRKIVPSSRQLPNTNDIMVPEQDQSVNQLFGVFWAA
ncbi:MAG: hypothetical protein V3S01_11480, partial [Dehalococcoidia bacterium]